MGGFVGNDMGYCPDCRCTTAVVLDHASGDTICTECALVLDEHFIDETSEWRTFSDSGDGGADHDPSRVGGPVDPFLSDAPLSTTIAPVKQQATKTSGGAGDGAFVPPRMHSDVGAPTSQGMSTLVDAFHAIADMADRLGLVATVRDRAKELFKKLEEAKLLPRGRNRDATYAACLLVASRSVIEAKPRTLKEMASATSVGAAAKKEIARVARIIKDRLGEEEPQPGQEMGNGGVVHAADYMVRFGSLLGLGKPEVRDARRAAERVEESLDVRRNPDSIAAAVIFMAARRAGVKTTTLKDVSMATGVAEGTIKEACKDLIPHIKLLFAQAS